MSSKKDPREMVRGIRLGERAGMKALEVKGHPACFRGKEASCAARRAAGDAV